MTDRAWMLFLSSNDYYVYLTLGVYKNLLDTKTKYPVYCAVTAEVNSSTRKILTDIGIRLVDLKPIRISRLSKLDYYRKAISKLAILDLTEFKKIVYLDNDLWIKNNIDELFDKPHMTAVINRSPMTITKYKLGGSVFCSGLFVWEYKKGKPLDYSLLPKDIEWHDQSVLNFFYQDWGKHYELQLDYIYGLMNSLDNGPEYEDAKIIHFVNRNRTDWPFERRTYETPTQKNFKKWVINLASAVNYFIDNYSINIPKLHPENIIENSQDRNSYYY